MKHRSLPALLALPIILALPILFALSILFTTCDLAYAEQLSAELLNKQAVAAYRNKNFEEAERLLKSALKLESDRELEQQESSAGNTTSVTDGKRDLILKSIYNNLAMVYSAQGKAQEAKAMQGKAMEMERKVCKATTAPTAPAPADRFANAREAIKDKNKFQTHKVFTGPKAEYLSHFAQRHVAQSLLKTSSQSTDLNAVVYILPTGNYLVVMATAPPNGGQKRTTYFVNCEIALQDGKYTVVSTDVQQAPAIVEVKPKLLDLRISGSSEGSGYSGGSSSSDARAIAADQANRAAESSERARQQAIEARYANTSHMSKYRR